MKRSTRHLTLVVNNPHPEPATGRDWQHAATNSQMDGMPGANAEFWAWAHSVAATHDALTRNESE